MRGDPQVVPARLRAVEPARSWVVRLEDAREKRRRRRAEELEVAVRLRAEERRSRRAGAGAPKAPHLHRVL